MFPVLPLEQALELMFAASWTTMKLIHGYTWLRALWVNVQLFAFLLVCVLLCAILGPIGLLIDCALALSALVYSIRD